MGGHRQVAGILLDPARDHGCRDLGVELDPPGGLSVETERLQADLAVGEGYAARRKRERVVVPLEDGCASRQYAQDRIGGAVSGERDVEPADLGHARRADMGARRAREHLRAETHSEDRHLVGEDLAQELLLASEPAEAVVLIRVLRATEDHHSVVARRPVRRASFRHEPALEHVPSRFDGLVEQAARDGRPVGDGEHSHRGDSSGPVWTNGHETVTVQCRARTCAESVTN